VNNLSNHGQAFVYVSLPPKVNPGSRIVGRFYVPSGAPPLVATIYAMDDQWTWSNGAFVVLNPQQWAVVSYQIPANDLIPIRELGMMLVGSAGYPPYTDPVYLDSVNVGQ
jgi:hypothetical protein